MVERFFVGVWWVFDGVFGLVSERNLMVCLAA